MSIPKTASYGSTRSLSSEFGSIGMGSPQFGRLQRQGSFGNMRDSFFWWGGGEQAQTTFLDQNRDAHQQAAASSADGMKASTTVMQPLLRPSSSLSFGDQADGGNSNTIRFQVIVWSIGAPDVKSGRVSMKFRLTLFWNDLPIAAANGADRVEEDNCNDGPKQQPDPRAKPRKQSVWVMSGRGRAYEKNLHSETAGGQTVDVPPVSILNAESFEVIGQPEISLLREDSRLMRWSCMYRAQLHQDDTDMMVSDFPHDQHHLCIKLGVLSQRQPGGRWDRRLWKLALANEGDTQRSIRIPYGLLVDHVRIPEFSHDRAKGLDFELRPLNYGSHCPRTEQYDRDFYLKVKLRVTRDSGYYDKNIMPVLGMLNLVAISILCLDATNFFNRGLMTLNIAFVEIGLRMTLDSRLPHVGYQIKMQKVLNWYFYSLLSIVLESSVLKFMFEYGFWSLQTTRDVDFVVAMLQIANQVYLTAFYMKREGNIDDDECLRSSIRSSKQIG